MIRSSVVPIFKKVDWHILKNQADNMNQLAQLKWFQKYL